MYLYPKNPYEVKYLFLINKRENAGLKHFNDSKAFIEYLSDMPDDYKDIEKFKIGKNRKILIVFDDIIADLINNKELDSIVTDFLIRRRKLKISLVFITQWYFKVQKDVRLNSTHFLSWKFQIKKTPTNCTKSFIKYWF